MRSQVRVPIGDVDLSLKGTGTRVGGGTFSESELEDPEPDLGIDIATSPRPLPEGDLAAINNSFGFGGHNVAVALTNANVTR
ncbi:MAG: hypothetical protein AAGC63_07870 [Propionicimonas sp.]